MTGAIKDQRLESSSALDQIVQAANRVSFKQTQGRGSLRYQHLQALAREGPGDSAVCKQLLGLQAGDTLQAELAKT